MKHFFKFYFLSVGLCAIAILLNVTTYAQEMTYTNLRNGSGISVSLSVNNVGFESLTYKSEEMKEIVISGICIPNDEGMPNLPRFSRFIAIPQGAEVKATLRSFETEVVSNINIAPALRVQAEDEDPAHDYVKNQKVYSTNAQYPSSPIATSELMSIRGVDAVVLGVTPFQYNPVTKELTVYKNIVVDIEYIGGNNHFGEDRLRSRWFDPILENVFLNYEDLPEIDYASRSINSRDDNGCEYLIVIPNDESWRPYAQQIQEYRIKQGIKTEVMSLNEMGCTNTSQMKAYFHNAYNTWDIPPVAVLLMADHGTNMTNRIPAESIYHPASGSCITDNQYADVTGDYLPEMSFSRMVAENTTQLAVMVSKTLEYEYTNPNMNSSTYQNPITALGWQTERWFQLCSEIVGGYWRNGGKTPVRVNAIYSGSPGSIWSTATNTNSVISYFGPNGLNYIPSAPSQLGGWTGGTAAQIVTAVNNGAFLLQHRDHGYTQGWGEPAFSTGNITQMTNVGKMTFVMSINCQTGKFDSGSECLGEAFFRRTYNGQNAGSVGVLCPTEISYSFVNDAFTWGVYDLFDPQFMPAYGAYAEYPGNWMPAFGNVSGKYFLAQSSWPYNTNSKQITYQMFTAHCDAFLRLYTEVPQNMNVTHGDEISSDDTMLQISAPAGSIIALTVGNDIIAVEEATGNNQNVSFAAQTTGSVVNIVVTKQNYLRYEDQITVINSSPNLNIEGVTLNDANGNGQLDYGEQTSFNITIRNTGGVPSSNTTATLSTSSPYITIIQNQSTIQGLNPDQTTVMSNVFSVQASNSVPNETRIQFNLHMTSGEFTWDRSFSVNVYALKFSISDRFIVLDQAGNNNNRMDPGENVNLELTFSNQGGSDAGTTTSTLTTTSPYITITNGTSSNNQVNSGQSITNTYGISVSVMAPKGHTANFTLAVASGAYSESHNFVHRIGLEVEDWESNSVTEFEWANDASHPWITTSSQPYEGSYCLQSGAITHGQNTSISIVYDVEENDEISFYYKTSTQAGQDKLTFYIDDVAKGNWSGTNPWMQFSTSVTSGEHTFRWEYSKNTSTSSGDDKVWIDYILFPVKHIDFVCNAGFDMNICVDATAQLQGFANGYNTIAWTTSGDGSFNDATVLEPIYTPGTQDISSGNVTLTMSITDLQGNTLDDEATVYIHEGASIEMEESTSICYNDIYTTSAIVTGYSDVVWNTTGDGTFDNQNSVQAIYTPGVSDIANGIVSLTLSATGNYGCSNDEATIALTINPAAEISLTTEMEVCANDNYQSDAVVSGAESTITWTTSGDGAFDDNSIANSIYSFGYQDVIDGSVVLTITAAPVNGCEVTVKEVTITILPTATIIMESEANICANDIYTTIAMVSNQTSVEWTTSGDGTFDNNLSVYAIYTPGSQDVENGIVELTLTAFSGNSNCQDAVSTVSLSINALPGITITDTDFEYCSGENVELSFDMTGTAPYIFWFEGFDVPFATDENGLLTLETPLTTLHLLNISDATGCGLDQDVNLNFTAEEIPVKPEKPSGLELVDLYETLQSAYTVNAIENADSYSWTLLPENAGTVSVEMNQVNVSWNSDFIGQCTLNAVAVNQCGASENSEALAITIKNSTSIDENSTSVNLYPNPTNDVVFVQIESLKSVRATINVYNVLGMKVLSEEIMTNEAGLYTQIDLSSFTKGLYLINIESENFNGSRSIVLK